VTFLQRRARRKPRALTRRKFKLLSNNGAIGPELWAIVDACPEEFL
jgi:hypothetical protein